MNEISALKRDPGRGLSPEPDHADIMTLDFHPPEL